MSALTESLAGRHVTIISSIGAAQERTDTGTLVAMTESWVQLAKDNGEMLLFPHTAVRVMKLLDVPPPYTVAKEDFIAEPVPPLDVEQPVA
jgi:hypothetical protein